MSTQPSSEGADLVSGVVLETIGGVYRLRLADDRTIEASLRGRLKREIRLGDRVVAGDRVRAAPAPDGGWTIEAVLPRETRLVRGTPGRRKPKVVAANVDRLAAVMAVRHPPFRAEIADRFLVLGELCGLEPVLVVNKMDLSEDPDFETTVHARYRGAGYPILFVSVTEDRGLDQVRTLLSDGSTILAGPSGVGKSSILNAVAPGLELRTGLVSGGDGRGRHTTVSARLLGLPQGGWVVDTPGFSEVEFWEMEAADLADAFPEFRERAAECRFRNCSHLHEPGCVVQEAVAAGRIHPERYESYRELARSL